MKKHRYEMAYGALEELRPVTAGTRLGGEVQFLLGENQFHQGKYEQAEAHYATYLAAYTGGPFSERALYMRALSKIRQIRKISIGFFTFRSYIPNDRDISVLKEARSLFGQYIDRYPSGQWIDEARERSAELLLKEGEHELQIASFYLRKDSPRAALARAQRVLEGDYPEQVRIKAKSLIQQADSALHSETDAATP
jgi:outer membrane protein assembly factor BamD